MMSFILVSTSNSLKKSGGWAQLYLAPLGYATNENDQSVETRNKVNLFISLIFQILPFRQTRQRIVSRRVTKRMQCNSYRRTGG